VCSGLFVVCAMSFFFFFFLNEVNPISIPNRSSRTYTRAIGTLIPYLVKVTFFFFFWGYKGVQGLTVNIFCSLLFKGCSSLLRDYARDKQTMLTIIIQDGIYPTRSFATLEPLKIQLP
jgi:hypothetical protein